MTEKKFRKQIKRDIRKGLGLKRRHLRRRDPISEQMKACREDYVETLDKIHDLQGSMVDTIVKLQRERGD